MTKKHYELPPAFPTETSIGFMRGMTLRDYFAGRALAGICSHNDTWGLNNEEIAQEAYNLADAMLIAGGYTKGDEQHG